MSLILATYGKKIEGYRLYALLESIDLMSLILATYGKKIEGYRLYALLESIDLMSLILATYGKKIEGYRSINRTLRRLLRRSKLVRNVEQTCYRQDPAIYRQAD